MTVNSLETLNTLVEKVKKAQQIFATYTQEQVDEIFRQTALHMCKERIQIGRAHV